MKFLREMNIVQKRNQASAVWLFQICVFAQIGH